MLFFCNSWIIVLFIMENGCLENVLCLKKILLRGKGRKWYNLKFWENFDLFLVNLIFFLFNNVNICYLCLNILNNYFVRGFVGEV